MILTKPPKVCVENELLGDLELHLLQPCATSVLYLPFSCCTLYYYIIFTQI